MQCSFRTSDAFEWAALVPGKSALATVYLSGSLIIELSLLSFHSIQPTPRDIADTFEGSATFRVQFIRETLVYTGSAPTILPHQPDRPCLPRTFVLQARTLDRAISPPAMYQFFHADDSSLSVQFLSEASTSELIFNTPTTAN